MNFRPNRKLVICFAAVVSLFYLGYRLAFTLNLTTPYAAFASIFLVIGESFGIVSMMLFFLQVWEVHEPPQQPVLEGRTVDIFIPTYNEDVQLLRATLKACMEMEYPHKVFLCDDGGTEARCKDPEKGPPSLKRQAELKAMCAELGVTYITRPDNRHAKAGNLNYAFEQTDGEFIVIFDADHVPEPNFITRVLGYFADPKLGFVQTPHAFYNFQSFQSRFDATKQTYWDEGDLFYKVIQPGRNRWGCPIFAGSAAMFRREAMKEIGYIAVQTITEDLHTGLLINSRGWKSLAISDRLVAGQAAPDVTTFHTQRLRWGEGNLSIMAYDNPLTTRGLTWPQRLCYFGSMIHWASGIFKLPIYLTPIMMMFTNVPPVNQFSWFLIGLTTFYLFVTLWAMRVVSNGYGSFFYGELFSMVSFWNSIRATFRASFLRKFQSFVVTSKRGRQANSIWPFVRPHLYLVGASLLALAWGWGELLTGTSDDRIRPILPTIWIVFHMVLALLVIHRSLIPEDRRYSFRHQANLPVLFFRPGLLSTENMQAGVTIDINELGIGLVTYEKLAVGESLILSIRGAAGESVACNGEVVAEKGLVAASRDGAAIVSQGFRYGIVFRDLTPAQTDALYKICLHYAVPRAYQRFESNRRQPGHFRVVDWLLSRLFNRRREARYPFRLPVLLYLPPNTKQPLAAVTEDVELETIPSVTEDVSRGSLAVLLEDEVKVGEPIGYRLMTPLGEVKGVGVVRRVEPRTIAAREYFRCVVDFKEFDDQGRTILSSLLGPEGLATACPVLKPSWEPLRIPVRKPLIMGLLAAIPLFAFEAGCFYIVHRDDLFLRRVSLSSEISEADTERIEKIYAATVRQRHPSTDRLVLLMAALNRIDRADQIAQVTQLLAPRDRTNLDMQLALVHAFSNTADYAAAEQEYERLLKLQATGYLTPEQTYELRLAGARMAVHRKDYDTATQRFEALIAEDPKNLKLRNEFAGVLIAAGQLHQAEKLFEGIEPDPETRWMLMTIHVLAGKYDQAEKECRAILAERPNDPKAERALADIMAAKNNTLASRAIYERLLRLNPTDPDLQIRMGFIALTSHNFDDALQTFRGLWIAGKRTPEVIKGLVDAASSAGELDYVVKEAADQIYEQSLTARTLDPVFLGRLAWVLQRVKEYDKAAVLLDKVASLKPNDPQVRRQLIGSLIAAGRTRDARRLIEMETLDLETRFLLVDLALRDKDFAAAAKQCREIVAENPDNRKALRKLADVLSWKGDYKESLELFAKLREEDPADQELLLRETEVLAWSGDTAQALPRFEQLLEKRFNRPAVWSSYIDAISAAGAGPLPPTQAALVSKIGKAVLADELPPIGLDGRDQQAAFFARLAWCLRRAGDEAESNKALDRAVALKPTEPAARKELAGMLAAADRSSEALQMYRGLDLDTEDHYRLAGIYAAEKDYVSALQQARLAVAADPREFRYQRMLADVLSWKGEYAEALMMFEKLRAAEPDDAELELRQAETRIWAGQADKGLPVIERRLEAKFDQPKLWRTYIDAVSASGSGPLKPDQEKLVAAIAAKVLEAPAPQPASPRARDTEAAFYSRLAWSLRRGSDDSASDKALDRALALKAEGIAVRKELAGVLAAANRSRAALEMYRGLDLDTEDHYRLAGIYAAEKDFTTALREARDAVKADPKNLRYQRMLADVLSWKGETKEALELFAKLRAAQPDDPELALRQAETFVWAGEPSKGIEVIEKRLESRFDQPRLWRTYIDAISGSGSGPLDPTQSRLVTRIAEQVLANPMRPVGPRERDEQATFLGRLAWSLQRAGDVPASNTALDQAVALKPDAPATRKELAGVLAAAGRSTVALRLYAGLTLTPEDHSRLAGIYAAARKFDLALAEAREAVEADPKNKKFQRMLADVLGWKGDHKEALAIYAQLRRDDPKDEALELSEAQVMLWAGDPARALPLYQRALEANFNQPRLWRDFVGAVSASGGAGRLPPAQARLIDRIGKEILAQPSKEPETASERETEAASYSRLAWALSRAGDPAAAGEALDRAVALKPTSPSVRKELGGVLAALDRPKDALALLNGLPLGPDDHVRMAGIYAVVRNYDAALKEAEAALKFQPNDLKARRLKADILSWKGDYKESLALFAELRKEAPNDPELPLREAEVLLWSGDFAAALPRFLALLDEGANDPARWRNLAAAAAPVADKLTDEQAKPLEAIANRVLAGTAPRSRVTPSEEAAFLSRLAWVLWQRDRKKDASELLDRAIKQEPDDPSVRKEIGGVLAAVGRAQEAVAMFEGLDLTIADHFRLAGLYSTLKDFEKAIAECRAILKLKPHDRRAERLLADTLSWNGDFKESLEVFEQLRKVLPDDKSIPIRQAEVTLWSGDYPAALKRYVALLDADFEQPRLWSGFVDAAASTELPGAAAFALAGKVYDATVAAGFEGAMELRVPTFLSRLAWTLYRGRQPAKAERAIDLAVALGAPDAAARREVAGVLAALGRNKQALEMFSGIESLEWADHRALAGIFAADRDYPKAEAELRVALKQKPTDRAMRMQLAQILAAQQKFDEAKAILTKLKEEAPDDAALPLRVAQMSLWSGDYDAAVSAFQQLLDADMNQPEAWVSFVDAAASASAEALGPSVKRTALAIASRLDDLSPKQRDATFLARLAWVFRRVKEPNKSVELLTQALELSPDSIEVRRALAEALQAAGRSKEAEVQYRILLKAIKKK